MTPPAELIEKVVCLFRFSCIISGLPPQRCHHPVLPVTEGRRSTQRPAAGLWRHVCHVSAQCCQAKGAKSQNVASLSLARRIWLIPTRTEGRVLCLLLTLGEGGATWGPPSLKANLGLE